MKLAFKFLLLAFVSTFVFACSNAPEGEKVEAAEAQEEQSTDSQAAVWAVSPAQSMINWTGTKPGGQHNGTINIKSGKIALDNGQVVGGEVIIDMTTIKDLSLEDGEYKTKLEGHLSSPDFFDVANHKEGSFVITAVKPAADAASGATHSVTGNLTLKGISKSVTFPANISMGENQVAAVTPAFTINRTEWDINFKSTTIGTLADNAINDEIGLVIKLIAAPGVQ